MLVCKRCNKQYSRKISDINRGRINFCSRSCSDKYKKERAAAHAAQVLKVGRKQCKACSKTKKLELFPKSISSATGYHSYCTLCRREINKQADLKRWSTKKEELIRQRRAAHLRREFGITIGSYNDLHDSQGGLCAICKEKPEGKLLAVDHSHKTGKIRGLLCENCNRGLGMFKDDMDRLKEAIIYLGKQVDISV